MLQNLFEWLNTPPRITRWLLIPTLLIPFLCRFGVISFYSLVHDWRMILYNLQLWRLVTPLFSTGFGINLLFTCYFRYQCMYQLEMVNYWNKPADLVFFFFFVAAIYNLAALVVPLYVFEEALTMSIVYLWAQYYRDNIVNFLFGMRFQAMYLPFVLLVMDVLYEKSLIASIVGLITGHIYYFLYVVYSQTRSSNILSTPSFL